MNRSCVGRDVYRVKRNVRRDISNNTQTDRFFETGQFERRSSLVNRISLVEADYVGN